MTTPTTDEALAEIIAGLEGVTPGPWHPGHMGDDGSACECATISSETCMGGIAMVLVDNGRRIADGGNDAPSRPEAIRNMRHIARMDPATVASMIARIEAAEAARSEARRLMSEASREAGEWKGRYTAAGYPGTLDGWIERAKRAEARVKALEEALWAIASGQTAPGDGDMDPVEAELLAAKALARAALEGKP